MADNEVTTTPDDGRHETPNERYDRNWNELMQEFRVLQTGTQIMAGFLLTLPFQQRFTELGPFDHVLYLCLVIFAVLVTLFALAPVCCTACSSRSTRRPSLSTRRASSSSCVWSRPRCSSSASCCSSSTSWSHPPRASGLGEPSRPSLSCSGRLGRGG